jgi:hypothetical protein
MNQNIECDRCPEGYIYNGYNCISCPIKTYNNKIGNNMCYPITNECPVDSRANFPGATHCNSETYREKIQRIWYMIIVIISIIYIIGYTGL